MKKGEKRAGKRRPAKQRQYGRSVTNVRYGVARVRRYCGNSPIERRLETHGGAIDAMENERRHVEKRCRSKGMIIERGRCCIERREIYSRTGKVKERGKGDTRRKMRLKEGRGGKKKGKDREIG